ncbi:MULTISPECIES: VOC family protein [Burkholderia]|uniref:VOC family protein n=1 Tax=Burkholderia contaminans TaxID=488447 RepID=A0A2S5DVR0_9BURK|nr:MULTISPECIES: VOC family protein [Burkholderia]EKS9795331.1 VOC family protein [Burkholderia cepacia]EKS9807598.1 VOC family protein [Burkholderia cepacia]EKS9815157.1 VOC family protein [Burkholderia cepacia]EKS9822869.1 VOC family protein [Burkholderia cepacia]EKS9830223.1 VOC family protein [Burkholderia cepacia]
MIPPNQHRLGIDHPVVSVRDHPKAVEQYKRLGFAPSPISYHPWGSVLTLMMFENNFIEVIGIDDPSKFGTGEVNGFCYGRTLGEFLERSEGLGLLALHSKDIDADFAAVKATGLPVQQRVEFRRKITTPDGKPDEAVVSLGMVMDTELGDASNFLCQQHRPEFIWRKDWQNHPNGAIAVDEVVYITPDLDLLEERWSRLFGADQTSRVDGHVEADTGCGRVVALTPTQAEERFASVGLPTRYTDKPHGIALQLRVRNLGQTEKILAENAVKYGRTSKGIAVTPDSAGNTIIEFVQ